MTKVLLSGCELLQITGKAMNLLELNASKSIPEMQIEFKPESILDMGSTGMKVNLNPTHYKI